MRTLLFLLLSLTFINAAEQFSDGGDSPMETLSDSEVERLPSVDEETFYEIEEGILTDTETLINREPTDEVISFLEKVLTGDDTSFFTQETLAPYVSLKVDFPDGDSIGNILHLMGLFANLKTPNQVYNARHIIDILKQFEEKVGLDPSYSIINRRDSATLTPLCFSTWYGNKEMSIALIESGANVDLKDNVAHYTPLINACQENMPDVVRAILNKSTETLNNQDEHKNTALHYACEKGSLEMVRDLLIHGADKTIRNAEGRLAVDMVEPNKPNSEAIRKILAE